MNANDVTRRRFLRRMALGVATLATEPFSLTGRAAAERPNFVLIMGDDISIDDFGCYGHPRIRTPNIDRLASKGTRFANAYLSTSQCSPTRCSILTGRYPHNTGAPELHMDLPPGQPMFTAALKKAGYYCAQAGKWHLGPHAEAAFDRAYKEEDAGAGGEETWIQCLRERPKQSPFFMWFSSHDAHRPWHEDPQLVSHTSGDAVIPPYLADGPATRKDLAQYYDEVHRLDRHVGLVISELERQGVLENTVVIFMADNGRPFPRCKTWLYDSGIKTPLIVHWPRGLGLQSRTCNSLVSALDIAPTILELAGVDCPQGVQGISFARLLSEPQEKICDYVFAERHWHTQRAHERMVRWKDHVYIRNAYPQLCQLLVAQKHFPAFAELIALRERGALTPAQEDLFLAPRPAEQLFHVGKDPHQLTNLVEDPHDRDVLKHLRTVLDEWQRRTGDTVPPLDQVTPDRYDLDTGERLYEGWRPPTGILPGQEAGAERVADSGPR